MKKNKDVSDNSITGNLPQSMESLTSLTTLHLQNNQFTGSINALAFLSLDDLDVSSNQFTGWIPSELKGIKKLETEGNSWATGPAPPPPPGAPKKPPRRNKDTNKGPNKTALKAGIIAAIVIGVLIVAILVIVLIARRSKSTTSSHFLDDEKLEHRRPFTSMVSQESKDGSGSFAPNPSQGSGPLNIKPPAPLHFSTDSELLNKFNIKKTPDSINATAYSLSDVEKATSNFGRNSLIGEGCIGCVYKADFSDGKSLVVKKIEPSVESNSSLKFMDVVANISKMRHPNIAELVGYCSEGPSYLLVYELLKNGSLHDFLHLSDAYSKPLTWNTRIRIALGTARAIEYLQEVYSPATVHKKIKSANILLDSELNPHLSDCGLATYYQDPRHNTEEGYRSPECSNRSIYTMKSDVYCFGVVMLELLTGEKPFDSSKPKAEQSLAGWATPQLHDIDALSKMVDPALRGLYPPKSLSRFADVIALCVQLEPEFRPSMSEVVRSLECCA